MTMDNKDVENLQNPAPALDEDTMAAVEATLGLRIPQELRSLYMASNGGTPKKNIFMVEGDDYEVHALRAIAHRRVESEPLVEETYALMVKKKKLLDPCYIPFADDSGGNLYCVSTQEPGVFFFSLDDYEPGRPPIRIASSVREFLTAMMSAKEVYV